MGSSSRAPARAGAWAPPGDPPPDDAIAALRRGAARRDGTAVRTGRAARARPGARDPAVHRAGRRERHPRRGTGQSRGVRADAGRGIRDAADAARHGRLPAGRRIARDAQLRGSDTAAGRAHPRGIRRRIRGPTTPPHVPARARRHAAFATVARRLGVSHRRKGVRAVRHRRPDGSSAVPIPRESSSRPGPGAVPGRRRRPLAAARARVSGVQRRRTGVASRRTECRQCVGLAGRAPHLPRRSPVWSCREVERA